MNTLSKAIIAAFVLGGTISTANAAGVITNITATDLSGGTFDSGVIGADRTLDIDKTFTSINPISLTFTVAHAAGTGNPYSVVEDVLNNTGQTWTDFHYSIIEPDRGQGVVFTQFNAGSTFADFTLDGSSGPRNLNFTGTLLDGQTANASFNLSPFDPGAGNTTTFTLTQVPTIPEPETYAMLLAGLLLMGGIAKRKSNKQ
ncbi:MAG: PEP-CTERM sorting domain-containing protein [Nitrosospira sp.]|nr:PEP-CTERM sorting domain-containing protein [Nitrosospira sp.]